MRTISDDDLYQRLSFDNPWWAFTPETELRLRRSPERAYFPPFAAEVMDSGDGRPLVLAGPVRAGKTVMVRQMVARLIEDGVAPTHILYCPLTTPGTAAAGPAALFDLFRERHGHGPGNGNGDGLYVFFDEIQYARDWAPALATLAAAHPAARVIAAVSSSAPALTAGADGEDGLRVFVLPPLTFVEFLRFRGAEEALFGDGAAEPGAPMTVRPGALTALNTEFTRYVNYGGFPEGVLARTTGAPAPTFIRDGVPERVLHKDLAGVAGISDGQELNRLFAIIALNTASEVSIEDLAKAAGVAKNTLRKYLDYLEQAFLIRRLPRVDRTAKRFQRAVAFKVYLTAPSLYTALYGPAAADDPVYPRLVETALVAQWLGAPAMADLAYASWRGGGIDLLSVDPATGRPDNAYEIDWADSYAPGGAAADKGPRGLAQFVDGTGRSARAYVLTRATARRGSIGGLPVTLAPAALYAYWVGRDPVLGRFHGNGGD